MSISTYKLKDDRFTNLAQGLAHSTEKRVRDRSLLSLKRFIVKRTAEAPFDDVELAKLWRGLHFCMWHSDKLLVQEELAKNISELIFAFTGEKRENLQTIEPEKALCFVASFLRLMETEWNSIDHDRLDKYERLVRKMFEQMFLFVALRGWREADLRCVFNLLVKGPLCVEKESGEKPKALEKKSTEKKKTMREKLDEVYISEDEFEENIPEDDIRFVRDVSDPKQKRRERALKKQHWIEKKQKEAEELKEVQKQEEEAQKAQEEEANPISLSIIPDGSAITEKSIFDEYHSYMNYARQTRLVGATPLDDSRMAADENCLGLVVHIAYLYFDAITVAVERSEKPLSSLSLVRLLYPFVYYVNKGVSVTLQTNIMESVFRPFYNTLGVKDEIRMLKEKIAKEEEENKENPNAYNYDVKLLHSELDSLQTEYKTVLENFDCVEQFCNMLSLIAREKNTAQPNVRQIYHVINIFDSIKKVKPTLKRKENPLTAEELEQRLNLKIKQRELIMREQRKERRKAKRMKAKRARASKNKKH